MNGSPLCHQFQWSHDLLTEQLSLLEQVSDVILETVSSEISTKQCISKTEVVQQLFSVTNT